MKNKLIYYFYILNLFLINNEIAGDKQSENFNLSLELNSSELSSSSLMFLTTQPQLFLKKIFQGIHEVRQVDYEKLKELPKTRLNTIYNFLKYQ
jgi:hypothetical protein